MPLAARSHRLGEALGQAGGLRAVPHQGRKRSPLFFDWNQLREHVVAVERFDADAEGVARGDGFRALACALLGLAVLAFTRGDGGLDARGSRRLKRSRAASSVTLNADHAADRRASSARVACRIGDFDQSFDGLAKARLAPAALFLGGQTRGFSRLGVLDDLFRAPRDRLLLRARFEEAHEREVGVLRDQPIERGQRDVLVLAVLGDVNQRVAIVSRARLPPPPSLRAWRSSPHPRGRARRSSETGLRPERPPMPHHGQSPRAGAGR